MKEEKPIRNFEDLPREWKDVDFLRAQKNQSIILTGVFGSVATTAWIYNEKIAAEIKIDPHIHTRTEQLAMGMTALTTTGLTLIGALAIYKLGKLIQQGNDIRNKSDNAPKP